MTNTQVNDKFDFGDRFIVFNLVNHDILLNKPNHYGFRRIVNDWFSSRLRITLKQRRLVNTY